MRHKDRKTYTIEKRKKQEKIEKLREKRYGKKDVENMNYLLLEAKNILGLL